MVVAELIVVVVVILSYELCLYTSADGGPAFGVYLPTEKEDELRSVAEAIVVPGKGILAADESVGKLRGGGGWGEAWRSDYTCHHSHRLNEPPAKGGVWNGLPDWHTAMHSLQLRRLLWICCPGHAGVSGNERADRLASTADITSGLQLGRAEVLRGLRNFLSTDKPEHHNIDRLKERGVEKGSGRHSTLKGRERSVFNQTNIGTVSRATLGRLLRDGAERVWAFPSATMPSWAETETGGKGVRGGGEGGGSVGVWSGFSFIWVW